MSNQIRLTQRLKISKWTAFLLGFALLGMYLLLPQFSDLPDIIKLVGRMDLLWIALGLLFTVLALLTGGLVQYFSGNNTGSIKEITVLSLAALFVSRFMPVNLGGITLVARYYKQKQIKTPTAISYAVLPPILAVLIPIILLILVSPVTLLQATSNLGNYVMHYGVITLLVALLCISLFISKPVRNRLKQTRHYFTEAWQLYTPSQRVIIAGSSILFTLFTSFVFLISAWSVDSSLPILSLLVVLITASVAGQIIPTPGGIGTTEALLILGLSGLGQDITAAITITLLFRLFLFWLPMLPGGFCFFQMVRRVHPIS